MPDRTAILKLHHLLEQHALTGQMMSIINDTSERRGPFLRGGTMINVTIIHTLSSAKNRERKRDPEMPQTRKGNRQYFGMKIHVCADVNSGLVPTVSVTPANASDIGHWPHLLQEDDQVVFGDKKGCINTSGSGCRRVLGRLAQGQRATSAHRRACYKGIAKYATPVFPLIGLTNLYLARHALMSRRAKFACCVRE